MGKIQINTEHARKMADDYFYVVRSFADAYVTQKKGVKTRPRLGDHMPFNYMRKRQTPTFLLYPELKEVAHEISRTIGESITPDQIRGKTLPEITEGSQPITQRDGYAFKEVVEADETRAVYRHYERADCYDLPNIHSRICVYETGTAAGILSTALGKPCRVTETRCYASNDPYREFLVEAL